MAMDVRLTVLSRALDQAVAVIDGVQESQLGDPTPCPGWDVGRLLAHLVAAPGRFVEMSNGGQPDWSTDPPVGPGEAGSAFRASADELLATWRAKGEDADTSMADWQTAEVAVHTWDLVRATGQDPDLDPEVAERGMAFMTAGLTDDNRGPAFGPEVPVPGDAPVYVRLAAVAGRAP
ncbi:TIGR03086 family metal-binding protein [Intrasporangium sp.]|uniref:TIGR03086 family metal-binding protein n=1 Tax=Intrasporangium sp. TaxID=1925024 RepID=UPI0033654F9E